MQLSCFSVVTTEVCGFLFVCLWAFVLLTSVINPVLLFLELEVILILCPKRKWWLLKVGYEYLLPRWLSRAVGATSRDVFPLGHSE